MALPSQPEIPQHYSASNAPFEEGIDIGELFQRLGRGLAQTLGLAMLGLVIAAVGYVVMSPIRPVSSSTRVIFAFDGFERGEYPDRSKFQSDDLRTAEIVVEALKNLNLDTAGISPSEIRGALNIEGIIPAEVVKQRDRMRAAGQTPPPYVPDEYIVTLTLPRKFPLSLAQRERLLNEIVSVFQEKFQRTYARLPVDFGNVHEALQGADFPDYVILLEEEVKNITEYLTQQTEKAKSFRSLSAGGFLPDPAQQPENTKSLRDLSLADATQQAEKAKAFRSSATNLSFTDLKKQVDLFKQIQLDDVLGLIRMNSLTRNKEKALMKLDYTLLTLKDQERLALEEEKVTKEYLAKNEARGQNYLVGIKSQVPQQRSDAPMLDQGLVDSLLANDSYNFTLRKSLDASLKVRGIQAEMAKVQERRKELDGSSAAQLADREATIKTVEESLKTLLVKYDQLIANIRKTHADYARQQFGNAIRLSDQIKTADRSLVRALIIPSAVGGLLGLAVGMGLSLLGIYVGATKRS